MEIISSKSITPDFIDRILEIDQSVYPKSLCGSYQSILTRFDKNTDSYLLVKAQNKIVGYMCFFPITDTLTKNMITTDLLYDDNITANDILDYSCSNTLFILSIAIVSEYQQTSAVKLLAQEFTRFIQEKKKQGFEIDSIYSIAISDDGRKFLGSLGLSNIKSYPNGYSLFSLDRILQTKEDKFL